MEVERAQATMRPWLSFRLRTLLVAVAVACMGFAIGAAHTRRWAELDALERSVSGRQGELKFDAGSPAAL